jgi:hypothetical protein
MNLNKMRTSQLSFVFLILLLSLEVSIAQSPQKISYQAVVRDASDELATNQTIGMQISILEDSETGSSVYVERHFPTTNANGLVSLQIETGTVISGEFDSIGWGENSYFIQTETDLAGGSNYSISGTSELLSVPYAMYAQSSASTKALNDGLLIEGEFGEGEDLEVSGAGIRLFFYPKKAAFRAGIVSGSLWNDDQIGDYSTA